MARWLGIDHGTKRIGLAVGDSDGGPNTPLDVIPAEPLPRAITKILDVAGQYQVAGLVVGLPVNMDDTEGPHAKLVRKVAAELAAHTDLDLRLWDERLSSFAADSELAGLLTRQKRRARQDSIAAAHILQEFFTGDGPTTAPHLDEPAG